MNLDEAVQKHAEWRVRFRSAIAKKERLDVGTISRDNCCVVGQWLHGDGKARLGGRSDFRRAVESHKAFHTQAGRVASLINAGKYGDAKAALSGGTAYTSASNDVGLALNALKKAAAL